MVSDMMSFNEARQRTQLGTEQVDGNAPLTPVFALYNHGSPKGMLYRGYRIGLGVTVKTSLRTDTRRWSPTFGFEDDSSITLHHAGIR